MSDAPFAVGQRVRVRPDFRRMRWVKVPTGVVIWLEPPDRISSEWWVGVHRDGSKAGKSGFFGYQIELIPTDELTLDQTAQALADAVKLGDMNAALVLADRVFELVGGTRSRA